MATAKEIQARATAIQMESEQRLAMAQATFDAAKESALLVRGELVTEAQSLREESVESRDSLLIVGILVAVAIAATLILR